MGKRTSYPPGTFSWVDLATTDAGTSKPFYGALFDWEMEDNDAGDGAVYTMCRVDGDAVCGLYEMSDDMRATGARPSWTSYVTVRDADATAARAAELGGEVIGAVSDVLDLGRMAVLKDAQGAAFGVWQPRSRIGAERVNAVGCLCMNDLATADMDAAGSFYEGLFGWRIEAVDMGGPDRPQALVYNGDAINGSLSAVGDGAPAHWRACFTVASIDTALARVSELGGSALVAALDIGHGQLATVLDSQEAAFMLYAGEVDP
jgi:predicted enzyme related to lactoylglutathione lyase